MTWTPCRPQWPFQSPASGCLMDGTGRSTRLKWCSTGTLTTVRTDTAAAVSYNSLTGASKAQPSGCADCISQSMIAHDAVTINGPLLHMGAEDSRCGAPPMAPRELLRRGRRLRHSATLPSMKRSISRPKLPSGLLPSVAVLSASCQRVTSRSAASQWQGFGPSKPYLAGLPLRVKVLDL